MIEPIDRNEAIRRFDHIRELTADQVVDMLKRVPSFRRKGKWIPWKYHDGFRCEYCNEPVYNKHNFCPNCGADMRGEKE